MKSFCSVPCTLCNVVYVVLYGPHNNACIHTDIHYSAVDSAVYNAASSQLFYIWWVRHFWNKLCIMILQCAVINVFFAAVAFTWNDWPWLCAGNLICYLFYCSETRCQVLSLMLICNTNCRLVVLIEWHCANSDNWHWQ